MKEGLGVVDKILLNIGNIQSFFGGRAMEILTAYLVTFGWALVGSASMGVGLAISLAIFNLLNKGVDEWALIREGSVPMAIVLAAVVIASGIVVGSAIKP